MVDDNTDKLTDDIDSNDDDKGKSDDSPDLEKADDEKLKDLDEKSQEIVKGFQKDYTQKTQKLAEERKEFEDKLKVGEKWYEFEQNPENAALVEEFNEFKANKAKKAAEPDPDEDDDDTLADPDVKKLKKTVAQTQEEMNNLTKATQVSNKMLVDLVSEMQSKKIRDLPFDIDPKKVLSFAKENSVVNMKRAIEGCYAEDIKEAEFAKRLEAAEEKWKEKEKTNVLTGTMPLGRQVRRVIARKRGSTE
jgi:F0F1-type ATP synthase membrane subunit b/b'